jgi:hypothetical protein
LSLAPAVLRARPARLFSHPAGERLSSVSGRAGERLQVVGYDRVAVALILRPLSERHEDVAPERLDVHPGEARQPVVFGRRMHAGQLGMAGDVEVPPAAGSDDLGEDPHLQPGQQSTHLFDVATVAGIDVDHYDDTARVGTHRHAIAEAPEPFFVPIGGQSGPALSLIPPIDPVLVG